MTLRLTMTDDIEAVLRASAPKTSGAVKRQIVSCLQRYKGEGEGYDTDDSVVQSEVPFIEWNLLKRCWKLTRDTSTVSLTQLVKGSNMYHRTPEVAWRVENPNRKADREKMKALRSKGLEHEYKNMTHNVDSAAMEKEKSVMRIKTGMSMPMDFFVMILVAIPAAYWIAKLSAREHWGWIAAAVATAGLVIVEGVLITIKLSRADGYLTPVNIENRSMDPKYIVAAKQRHLKMQQEMLIEKNATKGNKKKKE
eukprot:TRINITY_DN25065_c0_g1_i1.p1 TRINITY_DN25065_c0_g1~~TRINITY_DN25065_c0_g1_i1.p1  ORF type:complete len:266 (+),score=53.30 TRINITY_DN25065_c0_g1_i1:43-798(+)